MSCCSDNNLSLQGWALKGQNTSTKTCEKVKEFLIAKINVGLLSGKKANPFDVSMEMQDAKRDCCGFHQRNGKPHCK